jgi:hypothetical protein
MRVCGTKYKSNTLEGWFVNTIQLIFTPNNPLLFLMFVQLGFGWKGTFNIESRMEDEEGLCPTLDRRPELKLFLSPNQFRNSSCNYKWKELQKIPGGSECQRGFGYTYWS